MPRKGWKRPRQLTADEYGMSLHHMQAIIHSALGLAQRHPEVPMMTVLHSIALDADKKLTEAASMALRNETADSPVPRSTDHPLVTQGVGLSAEQDGRHG